MSQQAEGSTAIRRKAVKVGVVTSDKMDKSIVVRVHVGPLEHIAEEGPVGLCVLGVDDHVCAVDHGVLHPARQSLAKSRVAWRAMVSGEASRCARS